MANKTTKPVTKAASKPKPKPAPKPKTPARDAPEHPWEQGVSESDEAYEAFIVYRDLGVNRSHRAVGQKLGKSVSLISRWAGDWTWAERLTAWNRAERARLDAERAEHQKEVLKTEFDDAAELLKRYHEMIKAANGIHKTPQIVEVNDKSDPTGNKKEKVKIIEVDIAGLRELIKMRKDIRDLQRGAVGLPIQITQTQLTGQDGGPMDMTHTHKVSADLMADIAKQIEEYERHKRARPQRSDPTKKP